MELFKLLLEHIWYIAPSKNVFCHGKVTIFFLTSAQNMCCVYSKEAPLKACLMITHITVFVLPSFIWSYNGKGINFCPAE